MLHEEFEEYISEGEQARTERSKDWQMAIGLQRVDGLDTSPYLRNRTLHVAWKEEKNIQSAKTEVSKCQIGSLDCTLEEMAVLQVIKEKPNITQKELAVRTGKSERTIKRLTVALTERGKMVRRNGRRNGYWEIL